LCLLRLLVLHDLELACELSLDVCDCRWQLGHQLLEPGLHGNSGILKSLVDWLLVDQVELGHGEDGHQEQNEKSQRVEDAAHQVENVEEDGCKNRSQKVVPQDDGLGLVDYLVDVRLEPVCKLLNSLLGQSKISGSQFVDPRVIVAAGEAIVDGQVGTIDAHDAQRGKHEATQDREERVHGK